jgi:hypothetical protein
MSTHVQRRRGTPAPTVDGPRQWRSAHKLQPHEMTDATVLYNESLDAGDVAAGLPPSRPVWAVAPESIIVAPAPDTAVAPGELTEIWGWAWSFRGGAGVEISVDGGTSFTRAVLEEPRGLAWRRFSLPWRPTDRGEVLLRARAFEANGVAQPMEGARNEIHTVRVGVR